MTKPIRVQVDLDFTTKNLDKEAINEQINSAIEAVKINLDPQSAREFEAEIKELGSILQKHLNESTGKVNLKNVLGEINNRETFASIDALGDRYAAVGINARESFKQVADESSFLNKSLSETSGILDKMGTTLTNTIRWNISASVVNSFSSAIQQTYYYAKDLDRVLNDIRIVTGHSKEKMEEFAVAANEAARELKVSTIDYAEAATLFYQQGFGDQDVENMTRAAVMASKITGATTEEMSNLLTSTLNGYKMGTEQILDITDKFAAIGATTASSFEEIAIATSKVASMGNTAGVTIDELSAQLATIVSVTRQAPESVGTSLKTIYGRMLAFKTDTKALLKDDDGELFSAPDVEKALEAYSRVTGQQISLFETTASGKEVLRDLGEVINDIGNSWDKTNDKQAKFALTTAIAGSRQQNNLVALFDGWEMYQDAVVTSLEAEGTTLEQNAIYLESYEGKLAGLQASKENLFGALTDSDSMKAGIGALTHMVDLTATLVDTFGGFGGVVGVAMAAFSDEVMGIKLRWDEANETIRRTAGDVAEITRATEQQKQTMSDLQIINKMYGNDFAEERRLKTQDLVKEAQSYRVLKDQMIGQETLLAKINERRKEGINLESTRQSIQSELNDAAGANIPTKAAEEYYAVLQEITVKQQELASIETEGIGEAAAEGVSQAIAQTEADIDALEEKLNQIESSIRHNTKAAAAMSKEKDTKVKEDAEELNRLAETAREAEKSMTAFKTVAMVLPGILSNLSNDSSSLSDVLWGIGKSVLPLMTIELVKYSQTASLATLVTKGLAGVWAGTALPIILAAAGGLAILGGALYGLTRHLNSSKYAAQEYAEAMEEIDSLESSQEQVAESLSRVKERLVEIKRIKDEDEPNTEELELLNAEEAKLREKIEALEKEKQEQAILLEIERERAEIAAVKAVEGTRWSSAGNGFVSPIEDLEQEMAAYERVTANIEKNSNKLAELNKLKAEGKRLTYLQRYEYKNLEPLIESQKANQNKIKDNIMSLTKEAENLYDTLKDSPENSELAEGMEKTLEVAHELQDALADGLISDPDPEGNLETFEENLRNTLDLMYEREGIDPPETGLVEELAEEYDLLTQALAELDDQGYLNLETYRALMDASEEFSGIMELEGDEMYKLLTASKDKRDGMIDDSIAEQQQIIDSTTQIVEALKRQLRALQLVARATGGGPIDGVTDDVNEKIRETMGLIKLSEDDIKAAIDEMGAWKALKTKVSAPSRKKDKRKKGGSKKKSREREEYKAEADIYERINMLLSKNNSLRAMNDARRDNMLKGSKQYISSLKEEAKLLKERQELLHEKNQRMRVEAAVLQKELSGIFNFEGSWNDNSMMITNMEAIEGKSKETEEQFKRLLKIMEELPQGSIEWHKIQKELDNIDAEEKRLEFERFKNQLSNFEREVNRINLRLDIEGVDDTDKQMEALVQTFEQYSNAVVEAEHQLEVLLNKAVKPNSQAALDLAEDIAETRDIILEYKAAVEKTSVAIQDLTEAQKENIRQAWVDAKNAEIDARNQNLDAISEVQDAIVEIIRKRGEEEMRLLDEAHQQELKNLEDRRAAKQKANQKELDDYKKLIMDKIAALENAYEEEDYREQLFKEQEEAARLQKEIDVLSLDDSLTARNKRIDLREQLAAQIEKIEKMQQKRSREAMKQALLDELKDYEDNLKNKEDADEDSYNNKKKLLDEEYEYQRELLEKEYSNARVYAEAAEALIAGRVEVSKGAFEDIATAHRNFQREFGEGMGILGDIIQSEFIAQLERASAVMSDLSNHDLVSARRDHYETSDYDDSNLEKDGYTPPREPEKTSPHRPRPPQFDSWRKEDYEEYVNNKGLWKQNASPGDQERAARRNADLREYYWGRSRRDDDRYSYDDLIGYKDGGVVDKTGLYIGHGSEQSSEVVFSAKTAKKLWEHIERMPDVTKMSLQAPVPSRSQSFVQMSNGETNLNFNIEGNMDKSILPEVEKIVNTAIDKAEFQKRKELNKIGQFRLI